MYNIVNRFVQSREAETEPEEILFNQAQTTLVELFETIKKEDGTVEIIKSNIIEENKIKVIDALQASALATMKDKLEKMPLPEHPIFMSVFNLQS